MIRDDVLTRLHKAGFVEEASAIDIVLVDDNTLADLSIALKGLENE